MRFGSLNECKRELSARRSDYKLRVMEQRHKVAFGELLCPRAYSAFARLPIMPGYEQADDDYWRSVIREVASPYDDYPSESLDAELAELDALLAENPEFSTPIKTLIAQARQLNAVLKLQSDCRPREICQRVGRELIRCWCERYGQDENAIVEEWERETERIGNTPMEARSRGARIDQR